MGAHSLGRVYEGEHAGARRMSTQYMPSSAADGECHVFKSAVKCSDAHDPCSRDSDNLALIVLATFVGLLLALITGIAMSLSASLLEDTAEVQQTLFFFTTFGCVIALVAGSQLSASLDALLTSSERP